MNVISEEKLVHLLREVLKLSDIALNEITQKSTLASSQQLVDGYTELVNQLIKERREDSYLNDESWGWIWESRSSMNPIRIYGRLAWINLQLMELF